MTIVVPLFPFTPDEVADAAEFLESLAGLKDELGAEPANWAEMLADPDFGAALASFWAFMAGREPKNAVSDLLREAMMVTDEQFNARVQHGTCSF